MKIKATIYEAKEVEVDLQLPAYYSDGRGDFYAVISENQRINVYSGYGGYRSIQVNGTERSFYENLNKAKPCTREEFFEALNSVLSEAKYLEEATDLKVAI